MKPVVTGIGLNWASQFTKIKNNAERWGVVKITIPSLDPDNAATCIPLRKLFGWLCTISPNKVKPELKERIIRYQNECDDVLYQHWTKSKEPKPITIGDQQQVNIGSGVTVNAYTVEGKPWLSERSVELLLSYRQRNSIRKLFSANEDDFPEDSYLRVEAEGYYGKREIIIFSPKGIVILAGKSSKRMAPLLQAWAIEVMTKLPANKVLVEKQNLDSLLQLARLGRDRYAELVNAKENLDKAFVRTYDAVMDLPYAISPVVAEMLSVDDKDKH